MSLIQCCQEFCGFLICTSDSKRRVGGEVDMCIVLITEGWGKINFPQIHEKTIPVCDPQFSGVKGVELVWTFYSTLLARQKFYIEKNLSSKSSNLWYVYSSVPNRRACTFINFEEKIPPARPYLALHVYCFWEKNPPARLFFCVYKGICPARLLILRKKSPLHGLIWVCTFNVF